MKLVKTLVALCASLIAANAAAQSFPTKPVRVIVPFTPGSGTDLFARVVCAKLSELWSQQALVENRPGAGGSIGTAAVAKSPPDGYTLLWTSNAFLSHQAMYRSLPYDPMKDFAPMASTVRQPFALVVSAASGIRSVRDLVNAGKTRQYTFASAGIGTATHFVAEKFKHAAGLDAQHVPYKGGPEAHADVIAQRVTYWFAPVVMAAGAAREGRASVLGVTSAQRSGALPGVPTMSEAGLPGVEYSVWNGIWGPAGMPVTVVEKIAGDVARAIGAQDVREKLAQMGAEPMVMGPAQFGHFVLSELNEALELARAAGIKPE